MRDTEARFWMLQTSSLTRALRFAAIALGVGLVMAAGPLRAADDEDEDDKTFEEKIIEGIMRGIGGTNMENRGIEYRERSPLVVPPKLDLPPPAGTAAEVKAPNWPKDPDDQRRKAAVAARKKDNKDPRDAARILTPAELAVGKTAAPSRKDNDPVQPGTFDHTILDDCRTEGITPAKTHWARKIEHAPYLAYPVRPGITFT